MNTDFSMNQMIKQQVRAWDVLDPRILNTMKEVPRNRFVPLEYQQVAYADYAIPLDGGRSMLRPTVVGKMLQALNPQPHESVLEIGTGSGYVTACLATLAARVHSIDTQGDLIEQASQVCADLKLGNVSFSKNEGFEPDAERHYDVVVVNGSLPTLDSRYERLLNVGGRLFVTTGDAPVMQANLITRVDMERTVCETVFETELPRLTGAVEPVEFEF